MICPPGRHRGIPRTDLQLQRRIRIGLGRHAEHGIQVRHEGLPRDSLGILPQRRSGRGELFHQRGRRRSSRVAPQFVFDSISGRQVLLPHYNKERDKTFFFFNGEWRRYVQGGAFSQQVPNAAISGGVIPSSWGTILVPTASQVKSTELARFTALGLQPGQPFPNNTIPTALLSSAAQGFLSTGAFPGAECDQPRRHALSLWAGRVSPLLSANKSSASIISSRTSSGSSATGFPNNRRPPPKGPCGAETAILR